MCLFFGFFLFDTLDKHKNKVKHVLKSVIGKDAVVTPIKSCPMRVGGVQKSYGEQFLVIGDASGQCDPMTGLGLFSSMNGAREAALTIIDCMITGDLSADAMSDYQSRVFAIDFGISRACLQMIQRYPSLIDAAIALVKRRGAMFLSTWISAFHGSKKPFMSPGIALNVVLEALIQYVYKLLKK